MRVGNTVEVLINSEYTTVDILWNFCLPFLSCKRKEEINIKQQVCNFPQEIKRKIPDRASPNQLS